MKEKLSEWMSKARRLDAMLGARVDGVTRQIAGTHTRQPLEIVHAVVHAVATEVQPAGRGRHLFPFTHVRVWLLASTTTDKARLEAACEGPPPLEARIHERLATAGCSGALPAVRISFVFEARANWREPDHHVEFLREVAPPAPPVGRTSTLVLSVVHGTAEQAEYTFTGGGVTIGRGREVRDSGGGLLRTNAVAFTEDGTDVNLTVSRRHAHIAPDAPDHFRLHDDGAQTTRVIRDGRAVAIPRGRGLRLRTGDQIVLGQARVQVRISQE
jgi:hypothetical protein